jgi:hypothetical protein
MGRGISYSRSLLNDFASIQHTFLNQYFTIIVGTGSIAIYSTPQSVCRLLSVCPIVLKLSLGVEDTAHFMRTALHASDQHP